MARVIIAIEDGAAQPSALNKANVGIMVTFDPPVTNPNDARTWTAAQRMGHQAVMYLARQKKTKVQSVENIPGKPS